MSVVRQLIQIAMVEAVRDRTLAGADVFDSRMDPLPDLVKGVTRPFVIFSVEESSSQGAHDGPLESGLLGRTAELTVLVQTGVASGHEIKDGNGVRLIAAIGESDSAFEATLNILDRQWRARLTDYDNPWAEILRGLVTQVGKIIDTRSSDPETGTKHATRFVQVNLSVMPDPLPGEPIPAPIEAGLAAMEADGSPSYAEVARVWRALLTEAADWPDWRTLQAGLFATRADMGGIGLGPFIIDDLVDFAAADLDVSGVPPVTVTPEA